MFDRRLRFILLLGTALAFAVGGVASVDAKPNTGNGGAGGNGGSGGAGGNGGAGGSGGNVGGGTGPSNGPTGVDYTAPLIFGTLYNGNDCSGALGQPFSSCALNGSPIIAKYDHDTGAWQFNTGLFPGVDASDFNVVVNSGGTSGTFTYTPDAGDPDLTSYVLKAGNFFKGFQYVGAQGVQTAWTIDWGRGLSHISFYDTGGGGGPTPVPEPATLALLGAGLLGIGLARRMRRRT